MQTATLGQDTSDPRPGSLVLNSKGYHYDAAVDVRDGRARFCAVRKFLVLSRPDVNPTALFYLVGD